MRNETYVLDVPQTTAESPGDAQVNPHLRDATVQLWGFSAGTLQVHGSLDGTNFSQVGTDVTAPGFVDLPKFVAYVQIVCTVNLTGTGEAMLGGFQSRSDGG